MREKILFDDNWYFHEGDIEIKTPAKKGPMYIQAKTERMRTGPASRDYIDCEDDVSLTHQLNTDKWTKVNLPHDYVIAQRPSEEHNSGLGYFKYNNSWYRKKFTLGKEDKDKRITLLFEAVATNCIVYLNGCLIKRNFCGYTSFEADIPDFVDFELENVLAVYVNTQNHESWWYEGGGIYRHV